MEALAAVDPATLALPRPAGRRCTALATALAGGSIDLRAGSDWDQARGRCWPALPGIGPWTSRAIAMRALGDPDAFVPGDLGVRARRARLSACPPPRPR